MRLNTLYVEVELIMPREDQDGYVVPKGRGDVEKGRVTNIADDVTFVKKDDVILLIQLGRVTSENKIYIKEENIVGVYEEGEYDTTTDK